MMNQTSVHIETVSVWTSCLCVDIVWTHGPYMLHVGQFYSIEPLEPHFLQKKKMIFDMWMCLLKTRSHTTSAEHWPTHISWQHIFPQWLWKKCKEERKVHTLLLFFLFHNVNTSNLCALMCTSQISCVCVHNFVSHSQDPLPHLSKSSPIDLRAWIPAGFPLSNW